MLFFDHDLQLRLGLALVHFLWIACIPAALFALTVRLIDVNSVDARYRCSILTLGCLLPLFGVAFWLAGTRQTAPNTSAAESGVHSPQFVVGSMVNVPTDTATEPAVEVSASNVPASVAASMPDRMPGPTIAHAQDSEIHVADSWATYVTMAYLFGVLAFTLRLTRGYWLCRRMRRRASAVTDPAMLQLVDRIAGQMVLRTPPMVMWCRQTMVPTVVGIVRPVVLLPVALTNGVSIEQIEHVLRHEFIHLRRGDALVNFLQGVVETLLFFHPLVWWISRQVRLYRELSCDVAVVSDGIDPTQYAGTLIDVATISRAALGHRRPPALAAVSSISSRSHLRTRLERLLGRSTAPPTRSTRLADGASLMAVLLLVAAPLASALLVSGLFGPTRDAVLASPQVPNTSTPTLPDDVPRAMPRDIQPTELAGIVVDAEGNPLPGVTVDAWSWHPGDETTTNENGVFRFRPESENGRSKVEVRWMKPGYSPHYVAQQPVGVSDLVITLDKTTFIEGSVTAADGSPAAGVTVRAVQKDIKGDGVLIGEVPTETTTDESGKYRLYVHPDHYEISVASPLGVARTEAFNVLRGQALKKSIQLAPGVRFEAIVKDAVSGEPFSGLVLWNFPQRQFQGTSDDDGRLVIEGLLPGEFEFSVGAGDPIEYRGMKFHGNGPLGRWWSPQAKHPWQQHDLTPEQFQRNFDDLTFDLSPDMAPVEIFVEAGVKFRGHVYAPDGTPRAGATVAPAKTGSGNSLTGDTRFSATTEADGSYKVVMPAGNAFKYNLMAFDGEYSKWRKWGAVARKPLTTRPGQTIADYDFTLTRGATVRGKVTSIDDEAPPRKVRAHAADLRGNRYYDPTVEVRPDGTFELGGLRPGKHYIQVSPFWLAAADAENGSSVVVDVAEGEVREGVELQAVTPKETTFDPRNKPNQPVDTPAATSVIAPTAGGAIFMAKDKIFSTPCFDEASMYFGACDGNFYCLDKVTGELKWKVEGLQRVDSNPVLYEDKVFFTSYAKAGHRCYAVQAKTGKPVWEKPVKGCGFNHPLIHQGNLLIAGTNRLFSLDPDTGREIIAYPINFNGDAINTVIATKANQILALVTTDYQANDSTGIASLMCFRSGVQTPEWTLPLGGCNFGGLRCDEQRCYFGTRDGRFNAVDLMTGKPAWRYDCSADFVDREHVWPHDVIDNNDSLVVVCSHQNLDDPDAMICVDKATGTKRWSLVHSTGLAKANAVTGDAIITVGLDYKLMRIDRATGNVQFAGALPTRDRYPNGEFYAVAVDDGFAFIVDAAKQVWRYDVSKLK
ncbi:M56 family metallopeptidase [Rhodopirellula sp. JC639]|uniref:M56 family metallopeptidase n=1 Tax=Stieleria mannarensis TaxID=2755585 RepID=UPI0016001D01|nr:M56 family metallopeptidase [Rhodopirellula sp. JC639]